MNNNLRALAVAVAISTLIACATSKAIPLPIIPSVDATGVWLFENNDGSGFILSGKVDRSFDRVVIQRYLENELGYNIISNRITFN